MQCGDGTRPTTIYTYGRSYIYTPKYRPAMIACTRNLSEIHSLLHPYTFWRGRAWRFVSPPASQPRKRQFTRAFEVKIQFSTSSFEIKTSFAIRLFEIIAYKISGILKLPIASIEILLGNESPTLYCLQ